MSAEDKNESAMEEQVQDTMKVENKELEKVTEKAESQVVDVEKKTIEESGEGQDKNEKLKTDSEGGENLYAYLDRDDFTAEKFKIEVRGLPKYYGIGEFRRFLNEKLQLSASKIKPPKRGGGWAYICFRDEGSRENAIKVLHGIEWKKAKLTAHAANPAPDPYMKRRLERREQSNKKPKLQIEDDNRSPEEKIQASTIPLWNMPYEEQLSFKQKEIKDIVLKLGQEIAKVNRDVGDWLEKQKSKYDGSPIELGEIGHAKVTEGYRNKCEFTVGLDSVSKKKMIGFRLSSYAAGSTAVGPIEHLCHIPQRMKTAIKILEKFIQNSELDAFNPVDHQGYWRQITARTTRLDHLMLIVGINPQNMTADDRNKLKNDLKEFFEQDCNKEAAVTSLFFQTIEKKVAGGEGGGVIEHISGMTYIEETLLDMTFRISPESFFQINTLGAEVLYKTTIDLAQPSKDTSLLDVCCGTGTIGLTFAKHCDEILGVEMVPKAIENAKINAEKNNVTNCEFFVGKAEDVLIPVLNRITKPNIIAIVDPPRAGLHQRALVSLRKASKLKKLVYISCDPKAAIKNLVDLARPNSKQYYGEPLVPVKAVPVDMFPYTKHCELVLYLERFSLLKESNSEQ